MKEWVSNVVAPAIKLKEQFPSTQKFLKVSWEKLSKIPGGKRVFSKFVGRYIPYTGTVHPIVKEMDNGHAVVKMKDIRSVRNHLNSVHAVALANLAEFTTGLAFYSQLKENEKSILVKLEVDYLKKARGELTASSTFHIPESYETDTNFPVTAEIKDEKNDTVTKIVATWRVRL